ncbi:chemotaxis response regulator protein-glutamate methylesterase [Planktothrix sp. FACHB-1355]|uniref:Protein-glutamate methylesterase/protein-glutamine glutaminase n=1 Tax=Aerosakkonema funiforme FACHB-1375 TaxID=2949571 RepID=A0A926ZJI2_9CYAN|nr:MULTISPECIES: chemotaxis response regulator protein-glutamate methylesterase [Oscillatoriales]MBD2185045.1 chemotaxis response regulator protein-glutamate methylesterase [Aerosakkonema funiforme FACHB-1375]MBD3558070.1 chemotaxis response regulator protein-glutamate methylesterase [Planktothrix sp. FACHB-1355]
MRKIRLLIVDDSVMVRRRVSEVLSNDPALEVAGVAANGQIALAKIAQVNPDLVILDVEMPEMDGLETLAAIRKTYPNLPTIMFSAFTERGATATLEALSLGAKDYVTKPFQMGSIEAANQHLRQELIPKIKVFCGESIETTTLNSDRDLKTSSINQQLTYRKRAIRNPKPIEAIAIGVSTGGPNALAAILPQFRADFPVPILIVQHIPPMFSQRLATRLNARCQIPVIEGFDGAKLEPGTAYIAPGDFHMSVDRLGSIVQLRIHQSPPENSCRPAVDVLFRSVAQTYGAGALAVVLTGMGHDGLRGCEGIRSAGGQIFVQDKASSVVWGMPGFVAKAGLADKMLPLDQIAAEILRSVANCIQ